MKPKVSIIVPTYNVEMYLDRCISSLVNQTLREIEIILVDDESPDRCPQMCDAWAMVDSRIKVLHKKNEGLGFARNSGLEIATGEFVTFLDSDDYVEKETYETLYKEAVLKELDVCYFKHRRFSDKGKFIDVVADKKAYYFSGKDEVDSFLLNLIGKDPLKSNQSFFSMSVCMGIFRLKAIKNSGVKFVSERTVASEDLIFDIDFLPYVRNIGVLPNVFYNYFINPSSISSSFSEAKYQRMIKLLEVVKDNLTKNYSWKKIKNHYYSQQLRIIKIFMKYESKSECGILEKMAKIKAHCIEPIFSNIYSDPVISKYSFKDRMIILCMKHRIVLPIIFIYKYIK